MHIDQIDIDPARISELIWDQFPQFRGEEIVAQKSAGTVNAIFRIGSKYAARFPLRMMNLAECTRLLKAEANASAEFGRYFPFPNPKPIGIGRPGLDYPLSWLVQTWVEGQIASPAAGQGASSRFALDLVQLVTALRAADLKGRTFDGRGRGGSLSDHDDWMEVCFSKSENLLEVSRLRQMWRDFRELPAPSYTAMCHKDLIPANLLMRGERLIGVLDTGSFGPADPSLDLIVAWHLLDRDRRSLFRETLQVVDMEWKRGAAWAFQQAMGLVWYYTETNPVMSDLGRSTIARLTEVYGR
ncbi:aminoglycoside phosphotransferase family protein [Aliihoeflea sp. PC F10.4]